MVIQLQFLHPMQRYDNFKLIRNTWRAAMSWAHGKTEHGIFAKFKKKQQNCCRPHCRCHHLGYSVSPALHCTIWCRSTFGPHGPGLSNPTFLEPVLPILYPAQRYDNFELKNSAKLLYFSLLSRVLWAPALHCTIWCWSTFWPRGPGLSNPTFLRPARPMTQTTMPESNQASYARTQRQS